MRKKHLIFVLIILISSSCKTKNIIGKYALQNGSNSFEFKPDSTYYYECRRLHVYQYSEGTWARPSTNVLKLNSYINTTVIPLSVKNDFDKSPSNKIKITFDIGTGKLLSDYKCAIYINDLLYLSQRCDSLSLITMQQPINSLSFRIIKDPLISFTNVIPQPLFTTKYSPKNPTGNKMSINIKFKDLLFYYKPFNGDTLTLNRNAINLYNHYYKKWEKIPKIQDNKNVFSNFSDMIK
jgi:hypothetical protein